MDGASNTFFKNLHIHKIDCENRALNVRTALILVYNITVSLLHVREAATVSYLLCVSSFSSPVGICIRYLVFCRWSYCVNVQHGSLLQKGTRCFISSSSPKDSLCLKQVGSKCEEQRAEYSDGSKLAL